MRLITWTMRNPMTTGLVLTAWAGIFAEHDTLTGAAVVALGIGRAIIVATEISREGHDA